MDLNKCKKIIFGRTMTMAFSGHQCPNLIWKDGFCRRHHPEEVFLRREESYEKKIRGSKRRIGMRQNISISSELISEQKEEIRVLLEKLKKAEVSAREGRKIRKKLRRLGFRLRDFVGKTGITREERKKGIIRTAVEKERRKKLKISDTEKAKFRSIRKSLKTPLMTKKEEERIKGIRELKYPSKPLQIKIIKHAIMLAQHKYDTPSKIADILVDSFVGLSRSEATKFAKVALRSYKQHPLIEHAGMIEENPSSRKRTFLINSFVKKIVERIIQGNLDTGISNVRTVGTHIRGWDNLGSVEKDWIVRKAKDSLNYFYPTSTLANPPHGKVIYDKILSIEAEKGSRSNFPHEQFRHDFKGSSEAKVIGLEDGSLLVKSTKGKRLWKELDYD